MQFHMLHQSTFTLSYIFLFISDTEDNEQNSDDLSSISSDSMTTDHAEVYIHL